MEATYLQPFDLLAATARADRELATTKATPEGRFENWLPELDSNQQPPG